MKELAEQADERWRSQESFLDAPRTQQPAPAIGTKDPGGYVPMTEPESKQGVASAVEEQEKVGQAMAGRRWMRGGLGARIPRRGHRRGRRRVRRLGRVNCPRAHRVRIGSLRLGHRERRRGDEGFNLMYEYADGEVTSDV
jgi:hypothetical protein